MVIHSPWSCPPYRPPAGPNPPCNPDAVPRLRRGPLVRGGAAQTLRGPGERSVRRRTLTDNLAGWPTGTRSSWAANAQSPAHISPAPNCRAVAFAPRSSPSPGRIPQWLEARDCAEGSVVRCAEQGRDPSTGNDSKRLDRTAAHQHATRSSDLAQSSHSTCNCVRAAPEVAHHAYATHGQLEA